jgi:hypothetical protein
MVSRANYELRITNVDSRLCENDSSVLLYALRATIHPYVIPAKAGILVVRNVFGLALRLRIEDGSAFVKAAARAGRVQQLWRPTIRAGAK